MDQQVPTVLVTGATGYIGGRLITRLLERGYHVRVLVRSRERTVGKAWASQVEACVGDLLEPESLVAALDGVDTAYYLVHSMTRGRDYALRDREAASNFVQAARGIRRVIYLGGHLPSEGRISTHLLSRLEVGRILREGLPTLELRAGPIIGSGSASFELVRYLVERTPVLVLPRWIRNPVQPIGVRDMLNYLVLALGSEAVGVMDVGSPPITFRQMLSDYAVVRGLNRRSLITPPLLPPRVVAVYVGIITPHPYSLVRALLEGVVHPIVGDTARARAEFPEVQPMSYRTAVERALMRIRQRAVETRWSGALGPGPTYRLTDRQGLSREVRSVYVHAPPAVVFREFCALGGDRGWLVWGWLWRVRGILDQLVGGPGLRRGRRDPDHLLVGEAVDFWRVEELEEPKLLLLRAEMKVPGKAWLQFEAHPEGDGTRLIQRALFAPVGVFGALYWYALYPLHGFIFSDLVNAIAHRAEVRSGSGGDLVEPAGGAAPAISS